MKIEWFRLVDAVCVDVSVTEAKARVELRGAAPRERTVHLVRRGKKQHWSRARSRCAASDRLEDIVRTEEIDLQVLARFQEGTCDRRLRREMEDHVHVGLADDGPNRN